jgi:hypothetical protein
LESSGISPFWLKTGIVRRRWWWPVHQTVVRVISAVKQAGMSDRLGDTKASTKDAVRSLNFVRQADMIAELKRLVKIKLTIKKDPKSCQPVRGFSMVQMTASTG